MSHRTPKHVSKRKRNRDGEVRDDDVKRDEMRDIANEEYKQDCEFIGSYAVERLLSKLSKLAKTKDEEFGSMKDLLKKLFDVADRTQLPKRIPEGNFDLRTVRDMRIPAIIAVVARCETAFDEILDVLRGTNEVDEVFVAPNDEKKKKKKKVSEDEVSEDEDDEDEFEADFDERLANEDAKFMECRKVALFLGLVKEMLCLAHLSWIPDAAPLMQALFDAIIAIQGTTRDMRIPVILALLKECKYPAQFSTIFDTVPGDINADVIIAGMRSAAATVPVDLSDPDRVSFNLHCPIEEVYTHAMFYTMNKGSLYDQFPEYRGGFKYMVPGCTGNDDWYVMPVLRSSASLTALAGPDFEKAMRLAYMHELLRAMPMTDMHLLAYPQNVPDDCIADVKVIVARFKALKESGITPGDVINFQAHVSEEHKELLSHMLWEQFIHLYMMDMMRPCKKSGLALELDYVEPGMPYIASSMETEFYDQRKKLADRKVAGAMEATVLTKNGEIDPRLFKLRIGEIMATYDKDLASIGIRQVDRDVVYLEGEFVFPIKKVKVDAMEVWNVPLLSDAVVAAVVDVKKFLEDLYACTPAVFKSEQQVQDLVRCW